MAIRPASSPAERSAFPIGSRYDPRILHHFSLTEAAPRCHPERARGTRASEGPAVAQGAGGGSVGARNAWSARSPKAGPSRLRRCGAHDGVRAPFVYGRESNPPPFPISPFPTRRCGVILSERAERARAKDLLG